MRAPHLRRRQPIAARAITAVLGPTNTGKTHFAIDRMLAHRSGMIGLPLRLLAREVYDKVVRLKGADAAALITGEEKIVPPGARFFICTIEAMPLDLNVACLVLDEIQLCADAERGHVFTDRLLHARGEEETILLGSDTMRNAIERFIPGTYFVSRQRFSDLAYAGGRKLSRMPRRSAVVTFATDEVYALAELVRHQRGGAAVVLGALSPRTRNAQVALYQSGDVDFLIATDAVGMGLNMDVDHVAFAALMKFDGTGMRNLRADELGQIAGRAGRYMNDGTFGETAGSESIDQDVVSRIESHRYEPVRALQWRNSTLQFHSLKALIESLEAPPPERGLVPARAASDLKALRALSAREQLRDTVTAAAALRRLWDVCQLPDFRKIGIDQHVQLIEGIHFHLSRGHGRIPDEWLARQVSYLDQTEADVAILSGRLAQIRTWTYVSHRPDWVGDSGYWRELTRAVEDRLSDALHQKLTQRFIDRRTSVLMRRLRSEDALGLTLDASGAVLVDGEVIGKLEGFRFSPDPRADLNQRRTFRSAALRGLESEFASRAQRLTDAADSSISLSEHGKIWWEGAIVACLDIGTNPLLPRVSLSADEHLTASARLSVQRRLDAFMQATVGRRLAPLLCLRAAAESKSGTEGSLEPEVRGIAHQLVENLGSLATTHLSADVNRRNLIRALTRLGVWVGRRTIYLPKLLRPDAAALLALLWAIHARLKHVPSPPPAGFTSFVPDDSVPRELLAAAGYRVVGARAIRFDILERIEDELENGTQLGTAAEPLLRRIVALLGCTKHAAESVLAELGWATIDVSNRQPGAKVLRLRLVSSLPERARTGQPSALRASPFEGLVALKRLK